MDAYSVVLTSCGRFDLLEQTIRSLTSRLDGPLDQFIIIEDSTNPEVVDVVNSVSEDIRVIINSKQIGQLPSIDKAYAEVKTPLVFHCQDDWEFFGESFVEPSAEILEALPSVSLVSLRAREETNPRLATMPTQSLNGIEYFTAEPTLHPDYFGYSFNPGLRRMSDYRRVGPLADFENEGVISNCFKKLGYTMAYLEQPAVQHIGWERHVDDPTRRKRARNTFERASHSIRKRIRRIHHRIHRISDPAYQIAVQKGPIGSSRLAMLDSVSMK
jgi:hypothetical protein